MEPALSLMIATPDKLLVEADVEEVIAPGTQGYFGVLSGHCRFITTLKAGTVQYRQGGRMQSLEILGGFADVKPSGVTILAKVKRST
jgi:F-type H+-transporting ATPase subunit epsilon